MELQDMVYDVVSEMLRREKGSVIRLRRIMRTLERMYPDLKIKNVRTRDIIISILDNDVRLRRHTELSGMYMIVSHPVWH